MISSRPLFQWRHLTGIFSIAGTYIFFLIFAQFGFLELVKKEIPNLTDLDHIMMAMAFGGIFSSVLTAWSLKLIRSRSLLMVGFLGCGLTAFVATLASHFIPFVLISLSIGFFLGTLTVSLAAGLSQWMYPRYFGLQVGLGTGLAYWVCNIPAVFTASPEFQAIFSTAICLAGAGVVLFFKAPTNSFDDNLPQLPPSQFRGWGFLLVVASFLALVWLDSAAFYVIQQTGVLKSSSWGQGPHLWINGGSHFLFAVAAGVLIDRGWFRWLSPLAFLFLTAGLILLKQTSALVLLTGPIYLAGVSLYSTALVAFPSLQKEGPGLIPKRWRAAALYATAGWVGSALGIGMAQDLHRVPELFLILAGIVIFLIAGKSLFSHRRRLFQNYKVRLYIILILTAALIVLKLSTLNLSPPAIAVNPLPSIERGRAVYIQEGCINCHSQYVRPHPRDIEMFGPPHKPAEVLAELPPLIGNRRQGPDLLNVGLRRSSEWIRVQLQNPPSLHAESKMPSYDYLFRDRQGDDLTAYLSSLGAREDFRQERLNFIKQWKKNEDASSVSIVRARQLYQQSCLPCHGGEAEGDGPLAHHFKSPPRNLVNESFRFFNEQKDVNNEQLERIIKFGIMGTSMPGHEYFSDSELAGVASYIKSLRTKDSLAEVKIFDSPGEKIFLQSCAPCHGATGQGDGPASARLNRPPRNLMNGAFLTLKEDSTLFDQELKKIIQKGIPGTPMPGHAYLNETAMDELITYVKSLRNPKR